MTLALGLLGVIGLSMLGLAMLRAGGDADDKAARELADAGDLPAVPGGLR